MHAKERASTSHNERRVVDKYIKLSSNAGRKLKGRFHSRPRSDARDTHRRPNGKALKQKIAPIGGPAYFTWLASSHLMAARSSSVNEVTPNFSFARAQ